MYDLFRWEGNTLHVYTIHIREPPPFIEAVCVCVCVIQIVNRSVSTLFKTAVLGTSYMHGNALYCAVYYILTINIIYNTYM